MEKTGKEIQHMHYRIVEQGKVYALENNYSEALRHYREGIKQCQKEPNSDLFFQHYSQCAMEALELSGAHEEVISFCEKTLDFLVEKIEDSEYAKRYYSNLLERQAIQFLLLEDAEEAIPLFKQVHKLVGLKTQPLTDQLLNWAQRGYTMTAKQIKDAQKAHNYFIVRKENVNPKIALQLPEVAMPI